MAMEELTEHSLMQILEWRNHPNVRKNMYTDHFISEQEHKQWFKKMKELSESKWFIYISPQNEPVGVIYYTEISSIHKHASWGFYLGCFTDHAAGILMEYEALEYGFNTLNLHKLNCEILATNHAVIKFHRKFGFVQEGIIRQNIYRDNQYIDVVRMGLLKPEWLEQKPSFNKVIARIINR